MGYKSSIPLLVMFIKPSFLMIIHQPYRLCKVAIYVIGLLAFISWG